MKYLVMELEGALLDVAVALALRLPRACIMDMQGLGHNKNGRCYAAQQILDGARFDILPFEPSTSWAHGGPIIERENIVTAKLIVEDRVVGMMEKALWCSWVIGWDGHYAIDTSGGTPDSTGDTYLIAAMRAFVLSRCGDEVEL